MRSPEFIASLRLFRPAFVKSALAVLGFCILAGSCYAATALPACLNRQLETETALLSTLKNEVEPLLEKADQAALLQSRAELEQKLLLSVQPICEDVLLVRQTAAARRLDLKTITADKEGNLAIHGQSRAINEIAFFNSDLEELPGIITPRVVSISLSQQGEYIFEIEAFRAAKGGETE